MPKQITSDEKSLAMLAHLLGLFSGFIGPLIIYLIRKDSRFVHENARHSLNFQISVIIYSLISFILIFVLIGILLIIALAIFELVVIIIASVKSSDGKIYKYPLEIPFL